MRHGEDPCSWPVAHHAATLIHHSRGAALSQKNKRPSCVSACVRGYLTVDCRMADFPLGLSFDDVLLLPRLSAILPGDADISSQLVPGFNMKIPVLSAAMDTVSESELAIALAREGGLAVIHRNNPIDIQAAMVSRVKRFENAVIPNPVTVSKDMTLEEVHHVMMDQGYSGFPVVDANRKLEGIVTGRDMRGVDDYEHVLVKDVMTPLSRLITAAPSTTIEEARHILYTHRIEKLPLVDENGVLAGLITETDIQKRAMVCGRLQGRPRPSALRRCRRRRPRLPGPGQGPGRPQGLTPCSSTPPQAIPHA